MECEFYFIILDAKREVYQTRGKKIENQMHHKSYSSLCMSQNKETRWFDRRPRVSERTLDISRKLGSATPTLRSGVLSARHVLSLRWFL